MAKTKEGKPCPECAARALAVSRSLKVNLESRGRALAAEGYAVGDEIHSFTRHGGPYRLAEITPSNNLLLVRKEDWDEATNSPKKGSQTYRRSPWSVAKVTDL